MSKHLPASHFWMNDETNISLSSILNLHFSLPTWVSEQTVKSDMSNAESDNIILGKMIITILDQKYSFCIQKEIFVGNFSQRYLDHPQRVSWRIYLVILQESKHFVNFVGVKFFYAKAKFSCDFVVQKRKGYPRFHKFVTLLSIQAVLSKEHVLPS